MLRSTLLLLLPYDITIRMAYMTLAGLALFLALMAPGTVQAQIIKMPCAPSATVYLRLTIEGSGARLERMGDANVRFRLMEVSPTQPLRYGRPATGNQ